MQKSYTMTMLLVCFIMSGLIDKSWALSMSDDAIKQKIESEANDSYNLRAKKVKIAVENGYVVLYGTVNKYIQKMLYEKITWKTEGVVEVDNEIQVVPIILQTVDATERKVKEILQVYPQFQGVSVSVSVEAGAVDVLKRLNHPADVVFLKNRIAEIEGVISIDIQAKFIA
ncbi:MAG: BON domain-containing protein [Desulfobacterales bacterium]